MRATAFPSFADLASWRAATPDRPTAPVAALQPGTVVPGECAICGAREGFALAPDADGGVSLRESLACVACACNARQRAAGAVLLAALAGNAEAAVYLTEQASPMFVALRRRLPGVHGSEFESSLPRRLRLSLWLWRQGIAGWVTRQDVTDLSFADGRFDAVCSLDVLEHVPDHAAALREFARVLRPGGALVLTVPFHSDRPDSAVLARPRADGSIEHLRPPEYHGDPLGGGVLCFHHFGWDLLDAMRAAGFASAEAVCVHDSHLGWPQAQWVLRARR